MTRATATQSLWWLSEKGVLLGLTLVTQIVLTRVLGPSGFGDLAYVLALLALLLPVAQFGISGLVAKALLERPAEETPILRAALWLRTFGATLAIALGLIYWIAFESPGARVAPAALLALLAAQLFNSYQVLEFWFQARQRAAELVRWRIGALLAGALLKVAIALATRSVTAVAVAFAFEILLTSVAYRAAFRAATGHAPGLAVPAGPVLQWVRWLRARSPWLLASGIAEILYLKVDILLLGQLRGAADTGIYAVAARLSEVWYTIPVVLAATLFPALWARRAEPARYQQALQSSLDLLVTIALAIALLTQWLAAPLVELLFGSAYAAAAPVLTLHIWAGIFVFMRALVSRWLIAEDLIRFSLVTHLAGAVVNIAANLWLIPTQGPMGAAVATLLGYATASWFALFLSPKTRPMAWMMGRALLLPLRWPSLAAYARRALAGGAA